ncbi:hypothetical protein KAU11_10865 [Candidatus Babeliales bacterium]|nr:hypothetical protein [Candidatus Babeliales bacterium]
MSTIAFKDGILAADTQASQGDTLCGVVSKLFAIDGWRLGLTGNSYDLAEMHKFTPETMFDKIDLDDKTEVLAINQNGCVIYFCKKKVLEVKADFYAAGSGFKLALGAMAVGASAEEAVLAASKFDLWTNDVVEVLE